MAIIDNLVGYWKFDESSGNATDSSGAGLTLTNNNSTAYVTGKINNGADLEQSLSNYFNSSSSSFDLTSNFSFSCWIKPETISLGYSPSVLSKDSSGAGYNLRINYTNSKLEWLKHDGVIVVASSSILSTATWYFVTITFDGTNLKMYIDNSLETTTAYTSHSASASNFRVGNSTQYGTRYFDGVIDELGVWARDLTSAEVTSLYNSGTGLSYPFSSGTQIKSWNGVNNV